MTKRELIKDIAGRAGVSQRIAVSVLNATEEAIFERLAAGDPVALGKIGKIRIAPAAPRTVRNPRTGELICLSARKRLKIKPTARMTRAVNEKAEGDK